MYVPRFNVMDADEVQPFVAAAGSAELITVGKDGFPLATRLPVLWSEDRLIFHMALANAHWRPIEDAAPALAVVTGPEAYISPSWYATKAEHGRVVPTWNYSAVHFTGRATVRRAPEWLRSSHSDPRTQPDPDRGRTHCFRRPATRGRSRSPHRRGAGAGEADAGEEQAQVRTAGELRRCGARARAAG